jgi:hypothetical protein
VFQTAFQVLAFQINAFQIGQIPPNPYTDTHDGFTPEEIRRAKELALLKAQRADREARKAQIKGLVDPPKIVAKQKQNKLQSIQEVKAGIPPVDTTELEQSIAYLENQRSKLLRAVELRREQGQIRSRLAILETQRLAEQDDEESILLLI